MKKIERPLCLWIVAFFLLFTLAGQQDSLAPIPLIEEFVVKAARLPSTQSRSIYSLSHVDLDSRRGMLQLRSLSEQMDVMPGIFISNDNNYAQDQRITIRGFGARSAFGIRGIKLIVDGIPETTPDGQGQVDNLMLSDISSLEVIRGPSASLYGNASGGVISIESRDPRNEPLIEASYRRGNFGYRSTGLKAALHNQHSGLSIGMLHHLSEGYRAHSASEQFNFFLKGSRIWNRHRVDASVHYTYSPKGQDPGGVSIADVLSDRRQARDANVAFDAGEMIRHWKAGLQHQFDISEDLELVSYAFVSGRLFEGRLPLRNEGWIDLDRVYYGQGTHLTWQKVLLRGVNRLQVGYDLSQQSDDRERSINDQGAKGTLSLAQVERFGAYGIYLLDQWISGKVTLRGALRYDINNIVVDDRYLNNGDNSGMRSLSEWNPSVGINMNYAGKQYLFGSYSTSFETPTLSELSASPSGGFDQNLTPQYANNIEVGARGNISNRLYYDVAWFYINTKDEVLPFESSEFPGRVIYRNAGNTLRTGLEASFNYKMSPLFDLSTALTLSKIAFGAYLLDGVQLEGRRLPGIPQQQWAVALSYDQHGWLARLHMDHTGSLYADDMNMIGIDGRSRINFSLSHSWTTRGMEILPFVAINNVMGEEYFDNIRINAFGGRYFEAAPGATWSAGCTLRVL